MDYESLIQMFLDNQITALEFESQYLSNYLGDPGHSMSDEVFYALDRLFFAVDAYTPLCKPGEETQDWISEARLRTEAALALDRLKQLRAQG